MSSAEFDAVEPGDGYVGRVQRLSGWVVFPIVLAFCLAIWAAVIYGLDVLL
jgi:hypothetical protein